MTVLIIAYPFSAVRFLIHILAHSHLAVVCSIQPVPRIGTWIINFLATSLGSLAHTVFIPVFCTILLIPSVQRRIRFHTHRRGSHTKYKSRGNPHSRRYHISVLHLCSSFFLYIMQKYILYVVYIFYTSISIFFYLLHIFLRKSCCRPSSSFLSLKYLPQRKIRLHFQHVVRNAHRRLPV